MSFQFVRAVDNLERYNVARSNANIYHNVVIGNRVQLIDPSLGPSISPETSPHEWAQLLLDPITQLLEQHPSLALVLGDHLTAKPMFLRLRSVDILSLIRVVPIESTKQVGRVLEEEHNLPFDLAYQALPLWRIVIAPIRDNSSSFYLLYSFHHVIGDGRSAMALTQQLIEQLNRQAIQGTASSTSSLGTLFDFNIPITSTKPIPQSIESRVNCYPSLRTLLYEVSRALLLPGFLKKSLETKYWAGEMDSSLEVPNETQLGLLQLTEKESFRVAKVARERSTTVQSILSTAAVFAAWSVFMSEASGEAIVFSTPVSLRNLIPEPIAAEDQGNYTSEILHDNIRVQDSSSFWDMTHKYRRQVVEATTTARGLQDLLEHFGMLSLLPNKDGAWESFLASKVSKDQHGRKASVKMSNLGRGWDQNALAKKAGSEAMPYLIQDAIFSQSSGVTASALTMSVATAGGVMSVTVTWQRAAFKGRERGELFLSEFKRILLEAIQEDRSEYLFRDARSTSSAYA